MKILISNNLDIRKFNYEKSNYLYLHNFRLRVNSKYRNENINQNRTKFNSCRKLRTSNDVCIKDYFDKVYEKYKAKNTPYNYKRIITSINCVWTIKAEDFNVEDENQRALIIEILEKYMWQIVGKNNWPSISAIHFDETNPHIHFSIVPYDIKNKKWNAKQLTNRESGSFSFKKVKENEKKVLQNLVSKYSQNVDIQIVDSISDNSIYLDFKKIREERRKKESEDRNNNFDLYIYSFKEFIKQLNITDDALKVSQYKIHTQQLEEKPSFLIQDFDIARNLIEAMSYEETFKNIRATLLNKILPMHFDEENWQRLFRFINGVYNFILNTNEILNNDFRKKTLNFVSQWKAFMETQHQNWLNHINNVNDKSYGRKI